MDIRLDADHALYLRTEGGARAAQLSLVFGSDARGHLFVEFGVAVFDGCAPEEAVPTTVLGQDALEVVAPGPWTELIWPAVPERPWGTYGLSGSFSEVRMHAMAATMERGIEASAGADIGC